MKRTFFLLTLYFSFSMVYSQPRVVELYHYLFPEFTKGVVLMKSGIKNETMLNYNLLTEEMVFENKGQKLAINQTELVDTVFIQGRKFFPLKNKFIELLVHSKYDLYIEYRCSVIEPGKPAAYGGTSQTSATTSYSSYFSGAQVYELKLPDGYETKPYSEYWLKKEGKLTKFSNIRQLVKLLNENDAVIKEYIKEHDVKFNDQESIVGLLRFLSTR